MLGLRVPHAALAAALLPLFAPAAAAQTSPVRSSQEVVVTASAIPISAEWNSRTVVILSGADLASLGIRNLSDAMRLAPGVDVRARGPLGVQTDFSIRGATFGQVLVMVDGRRLNDSQSGHHNGELPIPVSAIDHIEVVNGASSSAATCKRWCVGLPPQPEAASTASSPITCSHRATTFSTSSPARR